MTPTTDIQLNQNGNWTPLFKDIFDLAKSIPFPICSMCIPAIPARAKFPFFTQKGLQEAIDKIGQELHNQYILTYSPNNLAGAGLPHHPRGNADRAGLKIVTL